MNRTLAVAALLLAVLPIASGAESERGMVNDGSFEQGACGAFSAWTCQTNTSCPNWILVPDQPWGVSSYDGVFVGQLGGLCGDVENSNAFCQSVELHGWCTGPWVSWYYLAIVEEGEGGTLSLTLDGDPVTVWPSGPLQDTGGQWLPMGASTG